jgi:hypothetical protein
MSAGDIVSSSYKCNEFRVYARTALQDPRGDYILLTLDTGEGAITMVLVNTLMEMQ